MLVLDAGVEARPVVRHGVVREGHRPAARRDFHAVVDRDRVHHVGAVAGHDEDTTRHPVDRRGAADAVAPAVGTPVRRQRRPDGLARGLVESEDVRRRLERCEGEEQPIAGGPGGRLAAGGSRGAAGGGGSLLKVEDRGVALAGGRTVSGKGRVLVEGHVGCHGGRRRRREAGSRERRPAEDVVTALEHGVVRRLTATVGPGRTVSSSSLGRAVSASAIPTARRAATGRAGRIRCWIPSRSTMRRTPTCPSQLRRPARGESHCCPSCRNARRGGRRRRRASRGPATKTSGDWRTASLNANTEASTKQRLQRVHTLRLPHGERDAHVVPVDRLHGGGLRNVHWGRADPPLVAGPCKGQGSRHASPLHRDFRLGPHSPDGPARPGAGRPGR